MTKPIYRKDGRALSEEEAHLNGKLRDGVSITFHSMMMDGGPSAVMIADTSPPQMHRPGYIDQAPADEMNLIVKRVAKDSALRDAWRNPPALDQTQISKVKTPSMTGDVYDRRDARLRDAWRAA